MPVLSLSQEQALLLTKILNGTLLPGDGSPPGPDWAALNPELASLRDALAKAADQPARICLVCGTSLDGADPRRTTCGDRCRQILFRSKRPAKPSRRSGQSEPIAVTVTRLDPPSPVEPIRVTVTHLDPPSPVEPTSVKVIRCDPSEGFLREPAEVIRQRIQAHAHLHSSILEAKSYGVSPEDIDRFRRERGLDHDAPLSDQEAAELLQECEQQGRLSSGRAFGL